MLRQRPDQEGEDKDPINLPKSSRTPLLLRPQHKLPQLPLPRSARLESAAREGSAEARAAKISRAEERHGAAKLVRVAAVEGGARMESAEARDAVVTLSPKPKPLLKRPPLQLPQIPLLLFEAITWYKRANKLYISQFEIN